MPKFSGRFNSLIVPLVTWLVLLIPFAIYQLYYVRSQEVYLTDHGFRLLTAVGHQLDSYIDSIRATVTTASREALEKAKLERTDPVKAYTEYLRNFLPNLALSDLTFQQSTSRNPAEHADNVFSVEFGAGLAVFRRNFPGVPVSGRLGLNKALRDRLEFGEDYFDDILIANSKGEVLFQKSEDARISNLDSLIFGPSGDAAKQDESKSKPTPPHETSSFETLSEFSNVREVKLAGDDYKLFLQPYQLSSTAHESSEALADEKLILCGLWRAERLHSDSFALPYSFVIWFGLFCVAAGSFVWPFLKINHMSRTERLRRSDGWLLLLSMFLGIASVTLLVLNGTYSRDVNEAVDNDLDTLSRQIQRNVERELRKATSELADLSADRKIEELANKPWKPQTGVLAPLDPATLKYPYFDLAFWADEQGLQRVKYTVDRFSTPQTWVNDRPFFKDVLGADHSIVPLLAKLDHIEYSLQPLFSPNTGLFSTVIAAAYKKDGSGKKPATNLLIEALVFRPLSLMGPILPPNFGFAVLARDGTVLFHSNPLRNLAENFVQECKDPAAMQAALFSDSPQYLDIVYSGKDRRVQLSKLRYLGPEPVTLVVFHNTEINRTVNVAIILIVSVLMGTYTLVIVIVAIIDLIRGATYPPKFIWPTRRCSIRYALVFVVNCLLVSGFLLVYSRLWESVLLEVTVLVLFAGIIGTVVLLTTKQLPNAIEKWDQILRPHFKSGYVAAAVSLLVVMTVIPCLGSFKFAHDAVSELAGKHGQLTILDALVERDRRISMYYQDLEVPGEIADLRMKEDLDRDDLLQLEFLSFHPTGRQPQNQRDGFQHRFDNWLEWAARLFPSNQMGGEMRMLPFAAYDKTPDFVQTQWNQLDYNSFRVTSGGKHPVDSTFAPWRGVGAGWIGLGLLWLLVGWWFLLLMQKIFLPDSQSPVPLKQVNWKTGDDIQANYLVLSEPHSGGSRRLAAIAGIQHVDLRVGVEDQESKRSLQNEVVALDHFDFDMDNRLHNQARLQLLERLVYKDRCRVVIHSSVDPVYYLSEGDPGILAENTQAATESLARWTKVMSTFHPVAFESPNRSEFDEQLRQHFQNPEVKRLARWIDQECSHTAYLRELGLALFKRFRDAEQFDLQTLRSELGDSSDSYYSLLWSTLTGSERLTLYQLAKDGWANPKNDRAIRQLQRKQFIRTAPMFRIMNESFRLFVRKGQDQREVAEWELQQKQSSWRTVKFSLVATAVALAAWLVYAQKDLFQGAIGYVITLGAGITAIANILGSLKLRSQNGSKPDTA